MTLDTVDTRPEPAVTVAPADITQALREAAMLADVRLSMWEANQNDKSLMGEVKKAHGAHGDVGKVIKFLLAGADSPLKKVRNKFKAVREHHKALTLPYVDDPHATRSEGPRLLPHLLNQRYMNEVAAKRKEAMAERDEFVFQYPDLVKQAKANLGTMVTDASYPSQEEVAKLFRITVDFMPIPEGSRFSGLDDHMLERLSKMLQRRQSHAAASAETEMWRRVRERVAHMVERLSVDDDVEKTFKAATVENVRELLTLLPGWNVTGNPLAAEIADDLDQILTGVDAKDLRTDKALREATAQDTRKVLDKLAGYGL